MSFTSEKSSSKLLFSQSVSRAEILLGNLLGLIATASEQAGWKALADLAYRRRGLAVSVGVLLAMIGLLLLKIRQVGNSRPERNSSRRDQEII